MLYNVAVKIVRVLGGRMGKTFEPQTGKDR
jgi:hypothetical protein